ncbi:hypothetical protein AcW1_000790 [Taiwanofungus camphoratus]|nr:hypothetical protein AcV7_000810 [Antrodia cinnamomea]KAI0963821.1 hypothetical protein AcW1_000790 [Antrodia cinnamomea]
MSAFDSLLANADFTAQQIGSLLKVAQENTALWRQLRQLSEERDILQRRLLDLERDLDSISSSSISGVDLRQNKSEGSLVESAMSGIRAQIETSVNAIALKESENKQLAVALAQCVEEKRLLAEQLEAAKSEAAQERIAVIEETNSLQLRAHADHEAKVKELQEALEAAQAQLKESKEKISAANQSEKAYRSVCVGPGINDFVDAALAQVSKASSSIANSPRWPGRPRKGGSGGKEDSVSRPSIRNGGEPINLAAHASPLPKSRQEDLAKFVEIRVALPLNCSNVCFSRLVLTEILGGGLQGLIVRVTKSAKALAVKWDIDEYLCPNMDHNPWLPTGPGKHGYMQVGLGRDGVRFNEPVHQHVFVGLGKVLTYCGVYEVERVNPLLQEEWETLPEKVKHTYSETTATKEKRMKHGTAKDIREKYDSGELLAPCVRLRCVKFDMTFYEELVAANRRRHPANSSPSASIGKRRRGLQTSRENGEENVDENGDEDEVPRLKRTRKATSVTATTAVRRKSSRVSLIIRNAGAVPSSYDDSESSLSDISDEE